MLHLIGFVKTVPSDVYPNWECSALHEQVFQDEFLKNYKELVELDIYFSLSSSNGAIFNVVGDMIHKGLINPCKVKYTLYDSDLSKTEGHYDVEGFLVNYPYGFFDSDREFGKGE